jgi:oxygen-independent coproporphyrinogen III oxidase
MAGVYIHIPFCKQACTYCDFHFSTSLKYVAEMTDAICTEIKLKQNRINGPLNSIYFGGGTPSVLSAKALQQIFDTLNQYFTISANAEITIEANPDDLTAKKIAELRNLPINRFSIGVQSFFNEDLVWMNRAHRANEAETCIKRSQDAGFENLSIDLIYGYPLLTPEKWLNNIQKTIALQTPHVSAYALNVEPRTALANAIAKGKQSPLNDAQSVAHYQTLQTQLTAAGFEHYEISNYSLPQKYALHNTNYWKGSHYLGIGPSAQGFDGYNRYVNVANNAKYLSKLAENKLAEAVEELSVENLFNEYIMTSLRTMWGASLLKINTDFGTNYATKTKQQILPYLNNGKLILENDTIYLTENGKLFADGIAADLFIVDQEF